jgi:ribosomal RNA-processing protein 17
MSVFKTNSKYVRDERGLAVPQAANDTFRSAQQKKKSASAQVISFDAGKREKFLSGFSKRRQARRKAGYLQQLEREREEKLELRREKRRELVDMVLQDR